jgi:hypothetical protein
MLTMLLLLAISTACRPDSGSRVSPSLSPASSPTESVTTVQTLPPRLTRTPEPSPLAFEETQIPLPRTSYSLTVGMDYNQHFISVAEKIRYVNTSADLLDEILLMVEPANYQDVFKLNDAQWEDGAPIEEMEWERGKLTVHLRQPLFSGEGIVIFLNYDLSLPSPTPSTETRPVPFGYTLRQANLVDWYPFVPPYISGRGWLAHQPGYFGEHQVYTLADFQVDIQLLDERDDLIIAASAPAELSAGWHRYRLNNARNFAWSISPEYEIMQAKVGETEVINYFFPVHRAAGERVLQTTVEALTLYSDLYGPYPRSHLSVVEADFLDGMEFDGLYFLSTGFYNLYQGEPGEYLVAIAAHETAHQWFYASVANDQALEPWLDEALCTYNERIYYEHLYPEALEWWWAYRINYYEPEGWVDGSIYNPGGYRAYRDAIYLNGAVFLEKLRQAVSDETYFSFMKAYVATYQGTITTGDDFFSLLSQFTDVDINPLLTEFFEQR